MILYVGASLYHILCFCIHKILNHAEEDAVLVIGDNIFSKSGMKELKEDLDQSKIFQRTIILNFIEGAYRNPYTLNEESDEEQVDRYIAYNEQWVEQWMEKKKLSLSGVTEYNLAIDHRHLGMYILSKKIPYQYFEDGSGLLSRENVQVEFHKKSQYASYAVTKRLHALGMSEIVTKKYANASAQLPGFYDDKMEDFHVIRLFQRLSKEDQQRVLSLFHARKIVLSDTEKKPVLYLTRYVRYLQKPTMEHHHYISALVLDLFAQGHPVVIKPHPRDFSGRYKDLFPDAIVLKKQFPSELLPFLYDGKFDKIITIGSTAIDALKDDTEEVVKLDVDFENKVDRIYPYIASIYLTKYLYPQIGEEEMAVSGCLMEFLTPLCMEILGFAPKEAEDGKVYKMLVMDEIVENEWKTETSCYLNTNQDYAFADYRQKHFEDISLLDVSVETEEESLGKKQDAFLYIGTNDQKVRQRVEHFSMEKEFPRTKIKMFLGKETKQQKEYEKIMAEILWMCYKGKHLQEEEVPFLLPQKKKKVSENDLNAVRQFCIAIRAKKENYENSSICTYETK